MKDKAEDEVAGWKSTVQAREVQEQRLRKEVQELLGIVNILKDTTCKSVDDFANRLKIDLRKSVAWNSPSL